jgi:hypothetical protein
MNAKIEDRVGSIIRLDASICQLEMVHSIVTKMENINSEIQTDASAVSASSSNSDALLGVFATTVGAITDDCS